MSGTLRELPPSKRTKEKRWQLRVYVGRDPDRTVRDAEGKVIKQGPPVHVSKVFRGGKRAAEKALDKLVSEVGDSKTIGAGATVGKLLDEWMNDLERLGKAQSTLETYKMHIEKHIRPGLGSIRLDKLSVTDVNRYLGELDAKGLAPRTIKLDHAVLSACLTFGVDSDWLKANPAKKAKLKPAGRNKDPILSTDQLFTLISASLEQDPDMAVAIYLAAATGCRRGELCGLRWDDLDTKKGTLRVERQWVTGEGGQYLKDMTKTRDRSHGEPGPGDCEGSALLPRCQGSTAWTETRGLAPFLQRRRDAHAGQGHDGLRERVGQEDGDPGPSPYTPPLEGYGAQPSGR